MLSFIINHILGVKSSGPHRQLQTHQFGGPPIEFDLKLFFGVIAISTGQLGKGIELLSRNLRLSLFFAKNAPHYILKLGSCLLI